MFKIFSSNFSKGIRNLGSRVWTEEHRDEELQRLAANKECEIFSYETLVAATDNFNPGNKCGSFRSIYKGKLNDGREIVVNKSSNMPGEKREELIMEAELLSSVKHPNVVKLFGYCTYNYEFLLVYEYVPNKSLNKLLFGPNGREQELDWTHTYDIIIGIARGLSYLHGNPQNCIIHHDIKPGNILLDHEWAPKIFDFSLSRRLYETQANTSRIIGTYSYLAPEYAMHGQMSVKIDVYSFGVLLLELISGKRYSSFASQEHCFEFCSLIDWAYKHYEENRSLEFLEPTLADSAVTEQVRNCITIGLLCVQEAPNSRPSMDHIVSMLKGNQGLMGMQIDRKSLFGLILSPSISVTHTPSISFDEDTLKEALEELLFRTENFNDVGMNSSLNSNQTMEEDSYSNSFRVPAQDGHEGQEDETLREKIDAQNCQRFSYETLSDATNGFASENVLGQGGFGLVYKGRLDDGREIAVKKSPNMSKRHKEALITEVELLSSVKHPNVVKLFGYCADNNEFLLIYEYVLNKSLDKLLFGPNGREQELDWSRTYNIIIGVARGLSYLHGNPKNCIIHRDIKPGNILLDHKWVPKISDFGISRLFEEDQTHAYTQIVGTWGYMAPEYFYCTRVSIKTDVYSFGVLVLELVSGKKYSFVPPLEDDVLGLLDWAYKLFKAGRTLEIMDPTLANLADTKQVKKCIEMGLLCTQSHPNLRPDMEQCVFMLIGYQDKNEIKISRPGIFGYRGYRSGPLYALVESKQNQE